VSIPTVDRSLWQTLLAEAADFAREGWPSSDEASCRARDGRIRRECISYDQMGFLAQLGAP
jgi:hypothetical protein